MKVFLLLLWLPLQLLATPTNPIPSCSKEYFHFVVETLASDSMKGRLPGTPEEQKSACFIVGEFCRMNVAPLRKKQYCHPFTYKNPDSLSVQSAGNIIAKIDTKSDYCILVTAHYDHIGYAKHHSGDPYVKGIHNGADDNASGVALLLGLAAWCKEHQKELHYDIVFAALSAEEDGLYGASELLKSSAIDTSKIICDLNFDMVGMLDQTRPLLIAEGALLHSGWDSLLPNDSASNFHVERRKIIIKGGADHCVFLGSGIPAILFSTGLTPHYHKVTDDIERLNFDGLVYLSTYMQEVLLNLNRKANLQDILK